MHGGAVMKPVGSTAVRDSIMKHQPMLSVHGHIHESRGIKKMGRTLALNPGSVYGDGVLQGAVIELNTKKHKVARYILVNG
jgi:Icc-related predicted phosphoesterase